jgi:hypothetical protein
MTIVPAGKLVFLHAHVGVDERLAAARMAQPVQKTPSESSTAGSLQSAASAESSTAGSQQSAASAESSTATASTEATTAATQPATAPQTPAEGNQPATSPSPQTTTSESQG